MNDEPICSLCGGVCEYNGGIVNFKTNFPVKTDHVMGENSIFFGKAYCFELNHNCICMFCLDLIVLNNEATERKPETCELCKKQFQDVYGCEGSIVTKDKEVGFGYGSNNDMDIYEFSDLIVEKWYCYCCLDDIVDKGKAKKIGSYDI
jgi:hypothetical protein